MLSTIPLAGLGNGVSRHIALAKVDLHMDGLGLQNGFFPLASFTNLRRSALYLSKQDFPWHVVTTTSGRLFYAMQCGVHQKYFGLL